MRASQLEHKYESAFEKIYQLAKLSQEKGNEEKAIKTIKNILSDHSCFRRSIIIF